MYGDDARLICLPSWDATFVDHVQGVVASAVDTGTPETLMTALRPAYPGVLVRASVLEGLRAPTWYVYRDGHFPWGD